MIDLPPFRDVLDKPMLDESRQRRRESDKPISQALRYGLGIAVSALSFLAGQWYHRVERYISRTDQVETNIAVLKEKNVELETYKNTQNDTQKEVIRQLQSLNAQVAVLLDRDNRRHAEGSR